MKIYVDRDGRAPSPRRVRMFLAEKGLDVPFERLAIHEENRTPEFREKNPVSTLPVLELDDGTCIAESLAICRYFEELHPEPSLWGSTPLEKATIEMWLKRVELLLYIPIELAGDGVLPGDTSDYFRGHAMRAMALLDRALAGREFMAGPRYTIADTFALSALDFGIEFNRFEIPEKREHLRRWHAALSARPSARA